MQREFGSTYQSGKTCESTYRSIPHTNQDKRSCPHNDRFHIQSVNLIDRSTLVSYSKSLLGTIRASRHSWLLARPGAPRIGIKFQHHFWHALFHPSAHFASILVAIWVTFFINLPYFSHAFFLQRFCMPPVSIFPAFLGSQNLLNRAPVRAGARFHIFQFLGMSVQKSFIFASILACL